MPMSRMHETFDRAPYPQDVLACQDGLITACARAFAVIGAAGTEPLVVPPGCLRTPGFRPLFPLFAPVTGEALDIALVPYHADHEADFPFDAPAFVAGGVLFAIRATRRSAPEPERRLGILFHDIDRFTLVDRHTAAGAPESAGPGEAAIARLAAMAPRSARMRLADRTD